MAFGARFGLQFAITMKQTRSPRRAGSFIEPLESRMHLSATTPRELTSTVLKVIPGQLGQPIEFEVTVRTNAKFGTPTGTVDLVDHGNVIQTMTLVPGTSPNAHVAVSVAGVTMPGGAGPQDYYVGAHAVVASFTGSNGFLNSKGARVFVVRQPRYVRQADGLRIATVNAGSGATIQAGQTATMMYTGYLAANGKIFDYSDAHAPGTFSFTVEASPEQVITGFDEGVVGMQVGETRALYIPYKLGYGINGTQDGSIPRRANLVFLVTLVSIA
jgi:hypothetical protein